MDKIIKIVKKAPVLTLCVIALIFYIVLQVVITFTSDGRWKVDKEGVMHFVLKDGTMAKSQFIEYLGKTYYVDDNSQKVLSKWIDNDTRFINNQGQLIKNAFGDASDGLSDLYYFDSEGYVLSRGPHDINGKEIYVQENNKVAHDTFIRIPEKNIYVYTKSNGTILKGTGLTDIDDKTYYVEKNGNIPMNQWYDASSTERYYLDIDGSVVKNDWVEDTYFLDKNGKMMRDTIVPDGSYVDKDGRIRFINRIGAAVRDAKKGETVKLGKYIYNENGTMGDLEWEVLDKDYEQALLITKYVIDVQQFNDKYIESSWEDSSLRIWLNRDFKRKVFNMNDIQLLDEFTVHNEGNYMYNIDKENDTTDKIFILSKEEHREYYGYADFTTGFNEAGAAEPTPYVKKVGIYMGDEGEWYEKYCNFWLRNPGYDRFHNMACMFTGNLDLNGFPNVSQKMGVRPCIVINYAKKSEIEVPAATSDVTTGSEISLTSTVSESSEQQ